MIFFAVVNNIFGSLTTFSLLEVFLFTSLLFYLLKVNTNFTKDSRLVSLYIHACTGKYFLF